MCVCGVGHNGSIWFWRGHVPVLWVLSDCVFCLLCHFDEQKVVEDDLAIANTAFNAAVATKWLLKDQVRTNATWTQLAFRSSTTPRPSQSWDCVIVRVAVCVSPKVCCGPAII